VNLKREQFIAQVKRIGLALAGQSADLVPADKKLYALRDVTATVDSIPLIAASIMSKKLAAGCDAFVLDVKAGRGAFMCDKDSAAALAAVMVDIASRHGKKAVALVTAMDSPLGRAVGNALEVKEALSVLRGAGPEDLMELTLALAAEMLALAGKAPDAAAARPLALAALQSGRALEMLARMVAAQGGATDTIDHPELLPHAPLQAEVVLNSGGYITSIDAMEIGLAVMQLGAGRQTKDDLIDLAVGVELLRKPGELAAVHEPVAIVHARTPNAAAQAVALIARAYSLQADPPTKQAIVLDRITQHT
jgi:pyrimidine-nucleoside phosphorylase